MMGWEDGGSERALWQETAWSACGDETSKKGTGQAWSLWGLERENQRTVAGDGVATAG